MFVIADGLVRMLAPILAVTADELWRHLPGKREDSVHMAEFPSRESVMALLDDELVARWERLSAIRDQVNAALEIKRQDKTIGTSLGARVTLRATGEAADLLEAAPRGPADALHRVPGRARRRSRRRRSTSPSRELTVKSAAAAGGSSVGLA